MIISINKQNKPKREKEYNNNFDVVVCCGPRDLSIISETIKHIKINVIGYRRIYIIPSEPIFKIKDCYMVNEKIFPFTIKDVAGSNGWYFQQLLKLYSPYCIPNILERYLVSDADTIITKPTTYVDEEKLLFNIGTEYHKPYFEHMKKLHPSLVKVNQYSGITHQMIFDKRFINALFELVEDLHKKPFWKVFLETISPENIKCPGASEYEIFFNFMHIYFPNDFTIRPLKYNNDAKSIYGDHSQYDYISCHHYKR